LLSKFLLENGKFLPDNASSPFQLAIWRQFRAFVGPGGAFQPEKALLGSGPIKVLADQMID
jgi:hypothetical protein